MTLRAHARSDAPTLQVSGRKRGSHRSLVSFWQMLPFQKLHGLKSRPPSKLAVATLNTTKIRVPVKSSRYAATKHGSADFSLRAAVERTQC